MSNPTQFQASDAFTNSLFHLLQEVGRKKILTTFTVVFFSSYSRTLSLTMTRQLKTLIPSSVWSTKGRPGSTVSALCWINTTSANTQVQRRTRSSFVLKSIALEELISEVYFAVSYPVRACASVCVCVLFFLSTHMFMLSSPRHGWTGRVWSHERTIHEDRGGLPARLLSHWQRKVSDSFRHVQTHTRTHPQTHALQISVYSNIRLCAAPPLSLTLK